YVTRFGFDKSQLPDDLTLALGTAELSPLQLATAYATFANGGFRVTSYYIDRIDDSAGKTLYQAEPALACFECSRDAAAATAAAGTGAVRPAPQPARPRVRSAYLDTDERDGKSLLQTKNLAPQVIRPQVAYLLS